MPSNAKDLYINIIGDSSKLKSALGEAENKITAFANKIGSIGKTMTIVGGAITAVSVGLVKMASDAEETSSKFATVFKDVSDEATKTAKNLADNFGLSTKAAKQLLSDTGDLLTGFGFTGQAALDLSTKVNELAVDLASFTNFTGGAEGASRALTKALLGERESVKSLGISIMETDVQAKVLQLTQQGMIFETERQAKAYATLFIAQEQSKNAIGDFSRTSEGFANQMRILRARVKDIVAALGEKLLPMATKLIGKVIEIVTNINEWIEAHPKLVEWVVKAGAVIGGLALVGGPILMAAAAFLKARMCIDSVTFALKLLNIKIGTTGALATGTLIPSLAKIGAKYSWLGAATGPIAIVAIAVGGLYAAWKTNLFGMRDITIEAFNSIKGNFVDLQNTLGGGGGGAGAFFDELGESAKGAGEKIETFDEWVKRITDEQEKLGKATEGVKDKILELTDPIEYHIKLLNDECEAYKKAGIANELIQKYYDLQLDKINKVVEANKKLVNLTKSLTDKIYEFTHTEYEVRLRDINREYDLLVENAKEVYKTEYELVKAIKIINEKRQEEIDGLKEGNKLKEETIEDNKDLADSYEELKKPIEEATEATKNLGILGGESFEGFTTQIKHATVSLNQFTVEGMAAAIASIKMHFKPLISSLIDDINNLGGIWKQMAEANLQSLKESMYEQISVIKYGYEEYKKVLASMGGGIGGGSWGVPSYQTGIRSVSKTQLALVHRGEEINPPGQRSYDQRKYSKIVNVYNPVVRNDDDIYKIKRAVQDALDEDDRQSYRQGKEILLGA